MTSPEILDIVPEHVADPVRRAPWPVRLGTAFGDGLLAAVLNAAVVGWLAGIGWPQPPAEAPAAISVDLVDHVPAAPEAASPAKSEPAEAAKSEAPPGSKPAGGPTARPAAGTAATEVKREAAATPEPAPPKPLPPAPPAGPAPHDAPEAAKPPVSAARPAVPVPERSDPTTPVPPAVPAPLEHSDDQAQPRLVEAPRAPRVAATQADSHDRPPLAPAAAAPTARPGPPPVQPKIVTAPSDETVAPPAPPPKTPAEVAEAKRQAAATAALAAVLPFGANVSGDPFQATVSAQGQALNDSYRGAVYGNFSTRAADVQAEAQARGLKGTAVVAFSVDGDGNLASSGIAVSSGQPEVDRMALEMIRRAAPYPPPPPGVQRSFSTALSFGSGD